MPATGTLTSATSARRTRVASRLAGVFAAAALIATALVWTQPAAAVATTAPRSGLAVLVLAPYLTFEDLSPRSTPALWKLAEDGAVGAVNARTADWSQPTAASGALTISASRWSSVDADAPATAADIAALQDAQADSLVRPVLGLLGEAVRGAGGSTAALTVFSAKEGEQVPTQLPAELAAMDTSGAIDLARIASGRNSGRAARRGDRNAFSAVLGRTLQVTMARTLVSLDASGGPRLLVLDAPALAASESSGGVTSAGAHADAVRELDRAVATARSVAPEGTTFIVVSSATLKSSYQDPDLGVAIVTGPGFTGALSSSSTHRDGLVTTLDVAPTLLDALDVTPPASMVGLPMTSRATSTPLAERLAALSAADVSTGVVDWLREAWFIRVFSALSLIAVVLALWSLRRGTYGSPTRTAVEMLLLGVAAVPAATWLMFLGGHLASPATALAALVLATLAVTAVLLGVRWMVMRRTGERSAGATAAALAVSSLTTLVILADQWSGNPLRTGLLSYSVRSGWRFYGMGNEGAALVVGASLVAVGLAVDALRGTRWHTPLRRAGIPVVGIVVLATTAAPFAGANAGAAIWGVVAYAVAWAAMNGSRLRLRSGAIVAALIVVAVAAIVALDLASPSGGSTHLARFAGGILGGDLESAAELVRRKLANNLGYFVATPYTLLFLGLAGVFALLRPGSRSRLRAALGSRQGLTGALLGAFVGGLTALATEDSSSVMPALLWFAALAPALVIALAVKPTAEPDTFAGPSAE